MNDFWAVVPAAGKGARFGGALPKQYSPLAGRTVIEWALAPLLDDSRIRGVVVALAPDDEHWVRLPLSADDRVRTVTGGAKRSDSVRIALRALAGEAGSSDWVLVHDAARPCLGSADLDRLMEVGASDEVGAILAARVPDTLKRAHADGRVQTTVDRHDLWRALTPQMFRLGELADALERTVEQEAVTDEAMAMELTGRRPLLIPGDPGNIKVTTPDDLVLAGKLLADRRGVESP